MLVPLAEVRMPWSSLFHMNKLKKINKKIKIAMAEREGMSQIQSKAGEIGEMGQGFQGGGS